MEEMTEEQVKLYFDNEKLIYFVGHKYDNFLFRLDSQEDVFALCKIGLIQACKTYNESAGKFSTYAVTCMYNQVNYVAKRYFERKNKIMKECFSIEVLNNHLLLKKEKQRNCEEVVADTKIPPTDKECINKCFAEHCVNLVKNKRNLYQCAKMLYIDGCTQAEVARILKVSPQRINFLNKQFIEICKSVYYNDIGEVS